MGKGIHNRNQRVEAKRRSVAERKALRYKWCTSFTLICVVLGAGAYVIHLGSTEGWPETGCTIAGSRVVRDVAAPVRSHVVVLYIGEYQLRYTVRGKDYYIWASAGWSDPEKQFVEAKMDYLPDHCNFRIRYNPVRPSEAFVVSKAQP